MARQRYCGRLARYRYTRSVSADPVAKPTAHSRAESRGSRPSTTAPGERRTLRWRETDSNFRSPEETTFSRPPRSSFESPPSGRGDPAPVSTRGKRAFRASPSASSADANNCERGRRWLQSVQGGPWSQVGGKGRARSPWGEGEAGTQALG